MIQKSYSVFMQYNITVDLPGSCCCPPPAEEAETLSEDIITQSQHFVKNNSYKIPDLNWKIIK